jgi:hypothetical protein
MTVLLEAVARIPCADAGYGEPLVALRMSMSDSVALDIFDFIQFHDWRKKKT